MAVLFISFQMFVATLEKEMATHSSILAWEIPRTEEPGGLQSMVSESWTVKKVECQRIDAFELWCWRRLLRVHWTARTSNQSILREINSEYSLEGLMLKLKLQYFGPHPHHYHTHDIDTQLAEKRLDGMV